MASAHPYPLDIRQSIEVEDHPSSPECSGHATAEDITMEHESHDQDGDFSYAASTLEPPPINLGLDYKTRESFRVVCDIQRSQFKHGPEMLCTIRDMLTAVTDRTRDVCDANHHDENGTIKISSSTKMAGQAVSTYLAKNIPSQYAPLGQPGSIPESSQQRDPNSKFCYRHRPDSKCRRTADEPSVASLQTELEGFSESDQQGIAHVWALFSAAPSKQREVILKGILAQACFPQLSYLSSAVKELVKIDFISSLPAEISYKILCYLDTNSLTKAAQVSQKWRQMADDDEVWHKMCEQHLNKKCKKCGWGLPLLEKQRLREYKRRQQLRATGRGMNEWSPRLTPVPGETNGTDVIRAPTLNGSRKRSAETLEPDFSLDVNKRQCTQEPPKTVPWKNVYKDRYKVSTNWKYGRYTTNVFRGHTNGVMCLQFDDKILATGSYDSTIKIWDIETGECLKTLRGHTSGVRALQFDGRKLISGSLDCRIKIWNLESGENVKTLVGHAEGVVSVNFENRTLVSGSIDGTVRVWDFQEATSFTLEGHSDWVNSVKLHLPSRTVFSASDDMTIRLWDLDTHLCIQEFKGHVAQIQQVVLLPPEYEEPDEEERDQDEGEADASSPSPEPGSPESQDVDIFADWPDSRPRPPRNILSASLDSALRLWSVPDGRCLKKIFGHVQGVWAAAGDNLRFVSGAQDKTIRVWDARTGKMDKSFAIHEAPVTCIGLSDCRIASGSDDNTAIVMSFRSEEVDAESPPAKYYSQS